MDKSDKMKIAIICCWFGKSFPSYFRLWLKSVAANPGVDFLIFGDLPVPDTEKPQNLVWHKIALPDLELRIRQKLNVPGAVCAVPYKICDYRPMFGEIFCDFLTGYDFWGHCDLDMIFGNLTQFVTPDLMRDYDKIYPNGHLSLYRNAAEVNSRWRVPESKFDVNMVITNSYSFAFDEWDGIYNIYMRKGYPFYRQVDFAEPVCGCRRMKLLPQRSNPKYERRPKNYEQQLFYWDREGVHRVFVDADGVVQKQDFVYIHFKSFVFPVPDDDCYRRSGVYFTTKGFIPKEKEGMPAIQEIKRLNPYPGILLEWWEQWWARKKEKIARIFGKKRKFAPKYLKLQEKKSWKNEKE